MVRVRKLRLSNKQYPCPCCGYMSFSGSPGSFDVCDICWWEDDHVQLAYPYSGGANIPLVEAQKNYAAFGASTERLKQYARDPIEGDVRDPQWRPFDPEVDTAEAGPQDGDTYWEALGTADGREQPYYWRTATGACDPK